MNDLLKQEPGEIFMNEIAAEAISCRHMFLIICKFAGYFHRDLSDAHEKNPFPADTAFTSDEFCNCPGDRPETES